MVLGYGGAQDGDEVERPDSAPGRDGRQSYNPRSAVQFVGAGELTEEQKKNLTEGEKKGL